MPLYELLVISSHFKELVCPCGCILKVLHAQNLINLIYVLGPCQRSRENHGFPHHAARRSGSLHWLLGDKVTTPEIEVPQTVAYNWRARLYLLALLAMLGWILTRGASYWTLHFDASPSLMGEMGKRLREDPRVIRQTVIKMGEKLDDIAEIQHGKTMSMLFVHRFGDLSHHDLSWKWLWGLFWALKSLKAPYFPVLLLRTNSTTSSKPFTTITPANSSPSSFHSADPRSPFLRSSAALKPARN